MNCEKYKNEAGQVAVLYSPGYGAGWYTWSSDQVEMLYDSEIVEAVLAQDFALAAKIAEDKYQAYTGGAGDLRIEWMEPGTQFKVNEYDGSESLDIIGQTEYQTA